MPDLVAMERRPLSDEEWVDAIQIAMDCDLPFDLRRKVVEELLDIRRQRKLRFEAMRMQFRSPPTPQEGMKT